jgi:hypothetical protein
MHEFAPGDIVEIEAPNGLAYLQVTHHHPSYPEVVRVLPGLHAARPHDLAALCTRETAFKAMVPIAGAIAQDKLVARKIGRAAIPVADRAFPTFKMAIRDKQGAVAYWWFWDGEGLRYSEDAHADTAHCPLREVLTAGQLLERLG